MIVGKRQQSSLLAKHMIQVVSAPLHFAFSRRFALAGSAGSWGVASPGLNVAFMFLSIWRHICAAGYYSFGHELARNLHAKHDRGSHSTLGEGSDNYG